ncbi:Uncharacterised protein [Bifidobacterium pseudocatenulatum]|nr:Uncharacterised protein [Bifidobacterium pseudocatenulatum]
MDSKPQQYGRENQWEQLYCPIIELIPNSRLCLRRYEIMSNILNYLSKRIQQLKTCQISKNTTSIRYIRKRVNDRHSVEYQLLKHIPNMGDITKIHVHGRHE